MFFPVAWFLGSRVYHEMLVAAYAPFLTPASFMWKPAVEMAGVPNIAGV